MLDRERVKLIKSSKKWVKKSFFNDYDDDDDEKEARNKSNYDLSILTAVGFLKRLNTCSDSHEYNGAQVCFFKK